jgi:Lysine-specific metallo-endopeptidase/Hemopexin
MREDFRSSIHMEATYRIGEPILLTFELQNVSDRDYALLSWNTPLEREVFDYIEVRHGDRVLPYDGRVVKRGDPPAEAYRRVAAGETVVEQVDLSTAFAFTVPGTYTVRLDPRFLDAIPEAGETIVGRTRAEHEGFALDPLSASFELLPDGEPRLTRGEAVRREVGAPSGAAGPPVAKLTAKAPVITGGTTAQQADARAAHDNAAAYADACVNELAGWTARTDNSTYTVWFGADSTSRYATVQDHYGKIRGALANDEITYDLSGSGCQAGWYAYTHKNTRKIWLCGAFWTAGATGVDSKFGTLVHELSHAAASTDDVVYGQANARDLAATKPDDAIRNADNHEYFAETLAAHMLVAPVVWNNGKAYIFVAGQYYRYDIASDRVDPGYPLPIAGNWPGLWGDRIDVGVVWPNGKAYFFRGSQYVRYDIASDRVDPGYPLPIAGHWPGLWGDGLDAAVVWPNGKAYFFRDDQYVRYDIASDRVDPGYPLPIAGHWPGVWGDGVNGAVVWPNGKAYFFRGWQYLRYDIGSDTVDAAYPRAIAANWPGLWTDRVRASVLWPNGKAYFFRGSQYVRYDVAADRVDGGYPLPIQNNWPGLWGDRIDAAVVWNNGKAYFFRDDQYMRYDIASDKVDPGYPLPIAGNWPGLWGDRIDAAVVWNNGKAYFFRDDQYMRYDIASDKVDDGYPLPIAGNWPGLWGDRIDSGIVWPNGKAYFFRDDQYVRYDLAADRVDDGYPLPIGENWPGLPGRESL